MCCATAVSVSRLCQLSALGNIPSSSNQKVVVFFCYSFKKCRELRGPVVGRCLTFSSTALLEIPGERVRMEWKWRVSYPLEQWLKPRAKWAWQSTMGKSVLLGQSKCHVLQLRCLFGEKRKNKLCSCRREGGKPSRRAELLAHGLGVLGFGEARWERLSCLSYLHLIRWEATHETS